MINSSNAGTSGRLYNRIRYLRKLHKANNTENEESATPQLTQNNDQNYSMDELLYLKSVVINENSMPEILKRLEITRRQRDEMVRSDTIDLMEHFPFFFTCPQLVSENIKMNFCSKIFHHF